MWYAWGHMEDEEDIQLQLSSLVGGRSYYFILPAPLAESCQKGLEAVL